MREKFMMVQQKEFKMGATQTRQLHKDEFNQKDWQEIQLVSYTNNPDPFYSSKFKVLSNRNKTYFHCQKYCLFFNSKAQYQSYLELYKTRKFSPFLVNSFHIKETTQKNMCATFHSASLYIQRIPLRLLQIMDVPLNEGMYMIQCALEGYEVIFEKTGYFQVTSEMIGINQQGKVKVWLNKNLSKHFPDFNAIDHNKCEADFVMKIVDAIEQAIDYEIDHKFGEFLRKRYAYITFGIAKKCLKEYCKLYNPNPTKLMKSVLIVFKGKINFQEKLNEKQETINTKTTTSQYNFSRNSYEKFPNEKVTKGHFNKNTNPTGTLHMSFINQTPNYRYEFQTREKSSLQKKTPKNPLLYKNSGLYSPQNFDPKKKWLEESKKLTKTQAKPKGKIFVKRKQQNQNLYFSTQKIIEIDPEIARDLEELNF